MRKSTKLFIAAEFREKKGHEVLFKALKKLDREDITLWIAGRGKLDVRRMAEDIGVSHQTVFLGAVPMSIMNILYEACDFFVLPSRTASNGDREGVPVAIMEAMSWRKPVISTRHAGIPELVSEILVDENDVDGLADAIAYLVDNPGVRAEMGERNYDKIKQEYSDGAVMELKEVFERSISGFRNCK
jgi:colanic acid/amylovoran biosynthesis glycosyltransferase